MTTELPGSEGGPPLEVVVRRSGPRAVIEVSGELDISTAPELSQAIQEVVDPELDRIELDCADLRFLDSTGLSVIMAAWKALNGRSSQPVVLRNARPAVERVLRVAGLDDLLIEH